MALPSHKGDRHLMEMMPMDGLSWMDAVPDAIQSLPFPFIMIHTL